MDLKLIVHQGQELLGNRSEVIIDADVYSIGRGNDNSWVLPDPKLHISNKHCVIHRKHNEFHLTDISTNGVYLNGQSDPLGRGRSQILKHGDSILIGEYLIKAALRDIGDFSNNTTPTHEELDSPQTISDVAVMAADVVEATKTTSTAAHDTALENVTSTPTAAELTASEVTLENLLEESVKATSPEPTISELLRPVSPEKEFYVPPKVVSENKAEQKSAAKDTLSTDQTGQAIPDNWLDLAEGQSETLQVSASTEQVDEIQSKPEVTLESLLDITSDAKPKEAEPEEPLEHLGEQKVAVNLSEETAPTFDIQERSMVSRLEEQVTQQSQMHRHTTPSNNTTNVDTEQPDLFSLMMHEAGLPEHLLHGKDKADVAKLMGRMLRQFAQGTIDTLATRSMVKSEFRLQQTMIRPVDNNPLKLSPSGDEALKIMLMGGSSAYLPAESSIKEGFKDIQAHQLAMMSGIQAAFMHLLQRFEPSMLTQKFESRPRYNKGLLSRNKTDLWREYQDYYHDICAMMEDEFQDLFSNEFGKAYENQLRKIR